MGILIAFTPFVAFALLSGRIGPSAALIVGALVSAALLFWNWLKPSHELKILELGTLILFAALALYTALVDPTLSIIAVRLCVDAGLLAIVLISIAVRRPFTMQYAREQVPAEYWASPAFLRTNDVITAAWAAAFALMVVAEFALLYMPGLPQSIGVAAIVAALAGAVAFTVWYPKHMRQARP